MFPLLETIAKLASSQFNRDLPPAIDSIKRDPIKGILSTAYDIAAPVTVQAALYSPEAAASIVPGVAGYGRPGGIGKLVDEARKLFKGKNYSASEHSKFIQYSQRELAKAGNPMGVRSVFMAPDGEPRLLLDDTHELLAPSFVDSLFKKDGLYNTGRLRLSNTVNGPIVETSSARLKSNSMDRDYALSDVLLHPNLYEATPQLANTRVMAMEPLQAIFSGAAGAFSKKTGNIALGDQYASGNLRNVFEEILNTVKHEATHATQAAHGVTNGTSNNRNVLSKALDTATAPNAKVLDYYKKLVADDKTTQDVLTKIYSRNYGEWEAGKAAHYGRDTNAALYLDKLKNRMWMSQP